jgi:hypothetical protein
LFAIAGVTVLALLLPLLLLPPPPPPLLLLLPLLPQPAAISAAQTRMVPAVAGFQDTAFLLTRFVPPLARAV